MLPFPVGSGERLVWWEVSGSNWMLIFHATLWGGWSFGPVYLAYVPAELLKSLGSLASVPTAVLSQKVLGLPPASCPGLLWLSWALGHAGAPWLPVHGEGQEGTTLLVPALVLQPDIVPWAVTFQQLTKRPRIYLAWQLVNKPQLGLSDQV